MSVWFGFGGETPIVLSCWILLSSMYLSMIEFSMTLQFVIKDSFKKNFQKNCYYVRQSFVGTLI